MAGVESCGRGTLEWLIHIEMTSPTSCLLSLGTGYPEGAVPPGSARPQITDVRASKYEK